MDTRTRNFVTLLGAIFLAMFAMGSAYLRPDIPLIWEIGGGLAVLGFIAYIVMEAATLKAAFSKKTTQYGLNSVVMSLVALGVIVFINLIGVDHDKKIDLTKNKLHTLSEQSQKVVKGLSQEVTLKAFINPSQRQEFDNIFDKYTYYNPKMLKKEFIDVDKDPFAVQKYQIKQQGTIIVESSTRSSRVDDLMGPDDPKLEEKLTNAIIQVAKGEKRKIYFLTGHGEHLISDTGPDGFSDIKESLNNGRYNAEELLLVDKDRVPADADIVVEAGPKSDLMDREVKLLEDYVKSGGKMLIMVDPTSTPTLQPLLAQFGVAWTPKKTVLETNRLQQLAGGNPLTPIVTNYSTSSPITQDARQMSIFPIPTVVEKAANAPATDKVETLFSTSARSLEVDMQGDKVKVDEKTDKKGPLSLAVSVTGKSEAIKTEAPKTEAGADKDKSKSSKDTKTAANDTKAEKKPEAAQPPKDQEFRVVVVGNSAFAANRPRRFGINGDLFQNMVSWLSHEEDLISIRPRATDTSEFNITDTRSRVINMASIFILPFMMFASGLGMWLTRRRM